MLQGGHLTFTTVLSPDCMPLPAPTACSEGISRILANNDHHQRAETCAMQLAALDVYSWLAIADTEFPLPAAITRAARNALQAPAAGDFASTQKRNIISFGLDLLGARLTAESSVMPFGPTFLAFPATAGASSPPPPQWQTDALDLAVSTLEQIGAPCCMPACLPVCAQRGSSWVCWQFYIMLLVDLADAAAGRH
jgi:hypothetical protein